MADEQLTPKQQRFAEEYLIDLNATQAAIRAGYSEDTAGSIGFENLKKPEIQLAIQQAMEERSKRTQVTADYILRNIIEVGERCMQKHWAVMVGHGRNRKQRTETIADPEIGDEIEANVWDFNAMAVLKAQELLGKHKGMWTERREISGPNGKNIQLDVLGPRLRAMSDAELEVTHIDSLLSSCEYFSPFPCPNCRRLLLERRDKAAEKNGQR